jgi:predicted RNA polymerase sigma factor
MIRLWVHDPSNPLEEYKSILIHQIHNQVTSLRSHLGETLGKDHKAYAAYDKAAEIVSDLKEKIIPFRELPHDMITEEIFSAMDSLK